MTCDSAKQLFEGFLEDQLSRHERQQLEAHLSGCPRCADGLREQLALDRRLQQALAASVHQLQLPPAASRSILQAVEAGYRQPAWRFRVLPLARALAVVLAMALLGLGLLLAERTVLPPLGSQGVAGSPAGHAALSVNQSKITFEPQAMSPGDRFTVTVPIESSFLQSVDSIRCDLEISGPTGLYRFVLFMQGPLPAHGLSLIEVTPDLLAGPSQDQYRLSPTQIFGLPGAYTFRATVYSPVAASSQ